MNILNRIFNQKEITHISSDLTLYYMEQWMASLNPEGRYAVQEELKSGRIVTHEANCSWEEAKDYVRMVYLPHLPAKFILRRVD